MLTAASWAARLGRFLGRTGVPPHAGRRRLSSRRPPPPLAAAPVAIATRALLARSRGGRFLCALDQLLGRDDVPFSCSRELEADPAALLVDLLHHDVEHVAAADHVLDVTHAARADVRDVQQPVRALLQLDERAELRRLTTLPVYSSPTSGSWSGPDRRDRGVALRALGA